MENYICKIANKEELIQRMDYLIEIHPNNQFWIDAKRNAIVGYDEHSKIMYIGVLEGNIICEATVFIKKSAFIGDIVSCDDFITDTSAYLSGFRTNKNYENKGFFGTLYRFIEKDLKERGYKALYLGVEPSEERNMKIYFHLGFQEYITTLESYKIDDTKRIINFYRKKI